MHTLSWLSDKKHIDFVESPKCLPWLVCYHHENKNGFISQWGNMSNPFVRIIISGAVLVGWYTLIFFSFPLLFKSWDNLQNYFFYDVLMDGLSSFFFILHVLWPFYMLYALHVSTGIRRIPLLMVLYGAIWVGAVVVYQGCPFTYVQEYLDVERGYRAEITYTMQDSIVYKYFFEPLRWVKNLFF